MPRVSRRGLFALVFLPLLVVLLIPAGGHSASTARMVPAICTANCGTNQSTNQPVYTTVGFAEAMGASLLGSGVVLLGVTASVYRHWLLGILSVVLIVMGLVVALFL